MVIRWARAGLTPFLKDQRCRQSVPSPCAPSLANLTCAFPLPGHEQGTVVWCAFVLSAVESGGGGGGSDVLERLYNAGGGGGGCSPSNV